MIPSNTLYVWLGILLLIGLGQAHFGLDPIFWWASLASGIVLALIDAAMGYRRPAIIADRDLPQSLALGIWSKVGLELQNPAKKTERLVLFDHFPASCHSDDFPIEINLPPKHRFQQSYSLKPNQRGDAGFGSLQIRRMSPLRFWWLNEYAAHPETVRVYPDFSSVSHLAKLAGNFTQQRLGVHQRRRRGEGVDFRQLREYRRGDSLRQLDWKATSRHRKLISREYQEERDQNVVLLLDCGRRMRTLHKSPVMGKNGSETSVLSHFDHALNSLLLLADVALRQGDAVGMQAYAGHNRWLAPEKGRQHLNTLLNQVYDLDATTQSPDIDQAVESLLQRQTKRSLVVVLSCLRGEDGDSTINALNQLSRKHVVLLANLREAALETPKTAPATLESAAGWAAAEQISLERENLSRQLSGYNLVCMDTSPSELAGALVNGYLDLMY